MKDDAQNSERQYCRCDFEVHLMEIIVESSGKIAGLPDGLGLVWIMN